MVALFFFMGVTALTVDKLDLRFYILVIKKFFDDWWFLFLLFLLDDLVYIFQTIYAANHVGDICLLVLGNGELELALVLKLFYSFFLGGLVVVVEVLHWWYILCFLARHIELLLETGGAPYLSDGKSWLNDRGLELPLLKVAVSKARLKLSW
jgi:hypothetical protein